MDKEMKEIMVDLEKEDDEVFEKELNQTEKVEPTVRALGDMGSFYKEITQKLTKDMVCFITKKPIADDEPFDIIKVPDNKLQPGMIAFVSVSKDVNTDEKI